MGVAGGLSEWPIAVWIVLIGAAVFIGRYAVLRWRLRETAPQSRAAERRLVEAAARLREFAGGGLQRLPQRLADAGVDAGAGLSYRPVPNLGFDPRLILLHDAQPTHVLLEFPSLRKARGLVLCSGRVLIVSESAFERLLAADDVLRSRLGLEPIEAAKVGGEDAGGIAE